MWRVVAWSTCFLSCDQALRRAGADTDTPEEDHTMLHMHLAVLDSLESVFRKPDAERFLVAEEKMGATWFQYTKPCHVDSIAAKPIVGLPLTHYEINFWCKDINNQKYVNDKLWIDNEQNKRTRWEGILQMNGKEAELMTSVAFPDLTVSLLFQTDLRPRVNENILKRKLQVILATLFGEKNPEEELYFIKKIDYNRCADGSVQEYRFTWNDMTGKISQDDVYNKLWYDTHAGTASAASGLHVWKIKSQAFNMGNLEAGMETYGSADHPWWGWSWDPITQAWKNSR